MWLSPNKLSTNVIVTIATIVMVFFLPWCDRTICNRLGVAIDDSVSTNPQADRLLHLRKLILLMIFGLYLLLVGYVTFFSREAAEDYLLHINFFHDISDSINIDFGILGFIYTCFTEGIKEAMTHVHIHHFENIYQVYMNICMFIPMGYLLPYVFDYFRNRRKSYTVFVCFLLSLAIENLQLVTKLGFYDVDDLFTNTFGGFLGVAFYMAVAYILAHPDWRNEMKNKRLWHREAIKTAMFPFFRKVHYSRITLFADDDYDILDFYIKDIGMYLLRTIENKETSETCYLLEYGKNQLEIRTSRQYRDLPLQNITLACNNSEYLKKRLERYHISTSPYKPDLYTGLRTFSFQAPDNTVITIIEE